MMLWEATTGVGKQASHPTRCEPLEYNFSKDVEHSRFAGFAAGLRERRRLLRLLHGATASLW